MRRFVSVVVLGLAPWCVWGQGQPTDPPTSEAKKAPFSASLTIPSEGAWRVWTRPSQKPGEIKLVEETSGLVKIEGEKDLIIGLWNLDTNRAAEKPIGQITAAAWPPKAEEFKRIAEAKIVVSHDQQPVAAAMVSLKAGSETRQMLLGPKDRGAVVAKNLPSGPLSVEVSYRHEDQDKKTQPVSITPAKEGPVSVAVEIPDAVETLTPPQESSSSPSTPSAASGMAPPPPAEAPGPGQNPFALFINFLIGAAVLGAIGYGVYMYFKKDPAQAAELLKKAGLDPTGKDQAPPPAVTEPAQKPLQPIVLPDAAPTPATGAVAVAPVWQAPQTGARLALEDGGAVDLPEGETLVGREPGLPVTLSGEKGVSRTHAVLRRAGSTVTVSDLGSTNGTYVNGQRIADEVTLKPGDMLIFGAARARFEA
jgi:hypothetical protein